MDKKKEIEKINNEINQLLIRKLSLEKELEKEKNSGFIFFHSKKTKETKYCDGKSCQHDKENCIKYKNYCNEIKGNVQTESCSYSHGSSC